MSEDCPINQYYLNMSVNEYSEIPNSLNAHSPNQEIILHNPNQNSLNYEQTTPSYSILPSTEEKLNIEQNMDKSVIIYPCQSQLKKQK